MLYLLMGSLFLLIVRPYEHFGILGDLHLERFYLITLLIVFAVSTRKKIRMDSVVVLYLMYFISLWICSLFGIDFYNSYSTIYSYTTESIVFILMLFSIYDERGYIKIIEAVMVITALYVLLSLREFLGGRFEYAMGMVRMKGFDNTYGQSNSFATTIVLSYPMLWLLLRTNFISKLVRYGLYSYIPISLLCLFETGSRGGFVQFVAFLGLLFLKSKRKFLYIVTTLVVFSVVWSFLPPEIHNRYYSLIDPSVAPSAKSAHEAAEGRIQGFKQGIAVWRQYPLLGVGPGNLIYTWSNTAKGLQAHNLVAQLLSDTGLLGTIPFVLLFSICYFRSNWIAAAGRKLVGEYSQYPDLTREARIVDFVSKAGVAIKQSIAVLFVAGLTGHNMLRYNWVYVVYLTAVGSWIMHRYINMKLEDDESRRLQHA
ncbi:O-Antigen ligase [Pseudodesulfovibrio hydrargyri]|uniref:O-Antigen ligase n=1 Tax=Pseudodesulfovibrio hydrargyri TaxID=2125990 RepID=A0A1J5N797_9BACT|nr:O-antigen ligase family protein [Pseudodesulfovibrio hydrargyri]OIQ49175.1 O-Antigen ligase [Pseudodesulfovibrio hydrargyri]